MFNRRGPFQGPSAIFCCKEQNTLKLGGLKYCNIFILVMSFVVQEFGKARVELACLWFILSGPQLRGAGILQQPTRQVLGLGWTTGWAGLGLLVRTYPRGPSVKLGIFTVLRAPKARVPEDKMWKAPGLLGLALETHSITSIQPTKQSITSPLTLRRSLNSYLSAERAQCPFVFQAVDYHI